MGPLHLACNACQTEPLPQQYEPPQHPCRGIPAGKRNAASRPEQQREQADQCHGMKLLPTDALRLHCRPERLCQKPEDCRKKPDLPYRRLLPADAQHRADPGQQQCPQPSIKQHPAEGNARFKALCQSCRPYTQRQCGKREFLLPLHLLFLPSLPDVKVLPRKAAVVAADHAILCHGPLRKRVRRQIRHLQTGRAG